MINIDQLRAVDIHKISSDKLAGKVKDVVKELEGETIESLKGQSEVKDTINSIYRLVEKFSPEAIPKLKETEGKKTNTKEEESTASQAKKPVEKMAQKAKTSPEKKSTEEPETKKQDLYNSLDATIEALYDLSEWEDYEGAAPINESIEHFEGSEMLPVSELIDSLLTNIQKAKELEGSFIRKKTAARFLEIIEKQEKAVIAYSESQKKQSTKKDKAPIVDNDELLKQLKALDPQLKSCREAIKQHNAKKKEAQGPKPKPTRHTQLKTKLLSIINLIPEKLAKDEVVLETTEEILLDTHSKLIEIWGMDKKKAQSGAAAIEEKFDAIEEKKDKEERKKLAKRWKNQLPDIDTLMRKEWKDSDGLENEAKDILDDLKESIKLYEQDEKKAKDFLTKRYSKEQLDKHLPAFILEQLFSK